MPMQPPIQRTRSAAIFCLASLALVTCGAVAAPAANGAVHATGTLHGASYRIDMPAHWNHRLVVFYHGTSDTAVVFPANQAPLPMFTPILDRGYAVIQSGYSEGGWTIDAGAADTERLREDFVHRYGKPVQTIAMGMSMGGTLTVLTIERHPDVYAGALSLCGAVEPSDRLMARDFALRAAFDYYFPNLLGPLVPMPAAYRGDDATTAKIAAALRANPKARAALLRWYHAADADNLAPVIADIGNDMRDLQQRTHGNPVGNADLVYVGSGDDDALNDGVRRYRADPAAAAWLAKRYTPTGELLRPMLELHDTGDPLVPAYSTFEYAITVQRAGHADNFVQQYVHHEGHCVFTPEQIGKAFHELTDWIDAGKRPRAGRLP